MTATVLPSSNSMIPPPPAHLMGDTTDGDSSGDEDSDDELLSPRSKSLPKTQSFIRSPSIISPPNAFSAMFTKGLSITTPLSPKAEETSSSTSKTPKTNELKTPVATTSTPKQQAKTPKKTGDSPVKTPKKESPTKKDSGKTLKSSSPTNNNNNNNTTTISISLASIPTSDSTLPPPPTWEYIPKGPPIILQLPRDDSALPPPPITPTYESASSSPLSLPRNTSVVPPPPRSDSVLPPPPLPNSDSVLPPPPMPNSDSVIPPPPSTSEIGLKSVEEEDEGCLASSKTLIFHNGSVSEKNRASRGRLTLDDALDNSQYRKKLEGFLEKNLCLENLKFLRAVTDYKSHVGDGRERQNFAISIVKIHLEKESPELVNLDSKTRSELLKRVDVKDFGLDLFDNAYQVIYNMVDKDVFRRWLTSKEYRDMATQERNADWSVERNEKKGTFFKKNVVTWRFSYNGEQHKVKLKHSPVGGKRVIFVDRVKMLAEKIAGGSQHPFKLINGDLSCCVNITYGLHGVEYELEMNGRKFLDAQLEL